MRPVFALVWRLLVLAVFLCCSPLVMVVLVMALPTLPLNYVNPMMGAMLQNSYRYSPLPAHSEWYF
jgi:hypothetical protein